MSTQMESGIEDIMTKGMELVDLFVNKNYLIDLNKCAPIPLDVSEQQFSYMTLFKIDKIVYDKNESINDKLISVYSALSNCGSSALLIISSDEKGVSFYLGTRDTDNPYVSRSVLEKSIRGNFPGIDMERVLAEDMEDLLNTSMPSEFSDKAITSVSIVPGMRDENDKEGFVQGIEKFIDTMAGESYTAVFVSSPLSKQDLEDKKRGYEELYSALSQCSQMVLTYGENEGDSVAEGISKGFSRSVNDGISDTTGKNKGTNVNRGRMHNHGFSFGLFGTGMNFGGGTNSSKGSFEGSTTSHSETYSETETNTDTRTDTKTTTRGSTASLQLTRHNKSVENLLEKIDEQLDRIKNCESYGLWDSACYFISDNEDVAVVAANTFKALVAGEETCVENSFVNTWECGVDHSEESLIVMDYLRYGLHPRFTFDVPMMGEDYDSQIITAASLISGVELPILMGLPYKSVSGVTSIESAEFGRNVYCKTDSDSHREINLGSIYHMGEVFDENRVKLNLETLTSHCFITGSTGSGKSNTTYKLIEEVTKPENGVKFMVIEPAKGEYKLEFGQMKDLNIYTTNPKYYSMLCINPFEFEEEIHVLEHLDRLIEIFSACWPLYAAMPAVLKSSFERAYIKHGWDLNHSMYQDMGNGKYPTFKDIVDVLPEILKESEFSAETKGNYIGSLVTRVESLTNGLVGQVFNGVSIPDETLFNENTIVDLSRVGSAETKALIMGILVLKLSEFRQATSHGTNLPLRHITIMEEAHNLLKRTSTEQGQESSNVQGKSVEMISNSIAEMRTYGEGFVIVDQSPSAVDISAIKNTNTKIVMRLPEAQDCESVGRSIGLNDDQIKELSRLDKGVAAVFQNDWLETVLVKIDKSSDDKRVDKPIINDPGLQKDLIYLLLDELMYEARSGEYDYASLKDIIRLNSKGVDKTFVKRTEGLITTFCNEYSKAKRRDLLPELVVNLLNCSDLMRMHEKLLPPPVKNDSEIDNSIRKKARKWMRTVYDGLDRYVTIPDDAVKNQVIANIILYGYYKTKKAGRYAAVRYSIFKKKNTAKKN